MDGFVSRGGGGCRRGGCVCDGRGDVVGLGVLVAGAGLGVVVTDSAWTG